MQEINLEISLNNLINLKQWSLDHAARLLDNVTPYPDADQVITEAKKTFKYLLEGVNTIQLVEEDLSSLNTK